MTEPPEIPWRSWSALAPPPAALPPSRGFLVHTPADTGMAFVPVQHLAPSHPSAVVEILARATTMPVMKVRDESTIEPNYVYAIE